MSTSILNYYQLHLVSVPLDSTSEDLKVLKWSFFCHQIKLNLKMITNQKRENRKTQFKGESCGIGRRY